jgi:hypothetical protein
LVKVEVANLKTLLSIFEGGEDSLICAPFFNKEGLSFLREPISRSREVHLLVRSNIYDWASGFANLEELCRFIDFLRNGDTIVQLYILSNLHAKIYAAEDQKRAYFGSANLTVAAFSSNLEIMTYVDGTDVEPVLDLLSKWRKYNPSVSVDDFCDTVELTKESVERVGSRIREPDYDTDEDFNAAVDLFSQELHKKVRKLRQRLEAPLKVVPDSNSNFAGLEAEWPTRIEEFIEFCQKDSSPAAQEIVDRYYGKSNLQGHIKHMFYGTLFFFYENPSALEKIPLDLHERERIPWTDEPWINDWKKYLAHHTGEFYDNIRFNYHTLVTYLPTTLGGFQQTGGASSGNFKKVTALLAKMLRERLK